MADSAAPAPLAVTGGRGTTEDDAMTENKRWWQAYLAALTGMHAYGQAGESYSIEGADRAAAQAAGLALTRWRAIGAQAESSGETAAALPEMCSGCVHSAKRAAEEPCASCVSGSGRGADRDAAVAHVRELEAEVQNSHDERDALRAKLGEAEKLSESWRSRIATAVGVVHEWDYGSAPGTWEQIEDKAASDRKQADATLDEAITYRDKCELMQNRITDLEEEARDAESRLTRDRDRLAGYVRAALRLSRDAHTHLLEERPEETAQAIYRVICALASAEKEGDDR